MPNVHALLPSAGKGLRFGGAPPKQFQAIGGRPMAVAAALPFLDHPGIASVHVVLAPDESAECEQWEGFAGRGDISFHRVGGETRAKSVFNGLQKMGVGMDDWVAVHDAVRPCISAELIDRMLDGLEAEECGRLAALPVRSTIKKADGMRITGTVDRKDKWLAQTPQIFRCGALMAALDPDSAAAVSDEACAFERQGRYPSIVEGDPCNIKVTTPADLLLAEAILSARSAL